MRIFKHPKSISHEVCAGESGDFQQLRSISHRLCIGESNRFQQPRITSHGLCNGERGDHVHFIHVVKNLMMICSAHVMQSRMMHWWKWIIMETRVARLNGITSRILFSNACFTIMASEMANLNPLSQVQEMYYLVDGITSVHRFPNTHRSQMYAKFLMLKDRAECFHQRKTSAQTAGCSV